MNPRLYVGLFSPADSRRRRLYLTIFGLLLGALLYGLTAAPVLAQEAIPDLGDAPDSTNHYSRPNMAYPSDSMLGQFPTVWETATGGGGPSGPKHFDAGHYWLGDAVSAEAEADRLPDADGVTNILNEGKDDVANQDHADDGWLNPDVPLLNCTEAELIVRVSRSAAPSRAVNQLYLNVWLDGNHDGKWGDQGICFDGQARSSEWIVQDFLINLADLTGPTTDLAVKSGLIYNVSPNFENYMRFTLSERPAFRPADLLTGAHLDGQGPPAPDGYGFGETEDYLAPGYKQPDIILHKQATVKEVTLGGSIGYTITATNNGRTDLNEISIQDRIPDGATFVPQSASASAGKVAYDQPSNTLIWAGNLPQGAMVEIAFQVHADRRDDNTPCERLIQNQAWFTFPDGREQYTPYVNIPVFCPDLGDAPDSTNHAGVTMTAYLAGPVQANFPTVFDPATGAPSGPMHLLPRHDAWLGLGVSPEYDADLLPDADGVRNLIPARDEADRDHLDDGVVPHGTLAHCLPYELVVQVTVAPSAPVAPRYVNGWFDWNRDGDWEDVLKCPDGAQGGEAPEWAVRDLVTNLGPGTHSITLPAFLPFNPEPGRPLWARVTLADGKAPLNPKTELADGRGPDRGYRYGETEDYLILERPSQPEVTIHKQVGVTETAPGGILEYTLVISNSGTSLLTGVTVKDPIPPQTTYVSGTASATAPTVSFDAGGPAVMWTGDLPANGHVVIKFQVQVWEVDIQCGGRVMNTAGLSLPNSDGILLSNPVFTLIRCPEPKLRGDLGDAPDSTNHPGATMAAYGGTPARYPTVFDPALGAPQGPLHLSPRADSWLGKHVTLENDADLLPDEDSVTNLVPVANTPDLDRADDGILRAGALNHCQPTEIVLQVTVAAGAPIRDRYLNAWFDWNRDGDWEDGFDCPNATQGGAAPEWAVQNMVTSLAPGTYPITLPLFLPYNLHPERPMWARFSIADGPAPANTTTQLADGRGPEKGYEFGETEDYLIKGQEPKPQIEIAKSVNLTRTLPGGILEYQIQIGNSGDVTATGVVMNDPIPAHTTYITGSATATVPVGNYDDPHNAVVWSGDIPPHSHVMVQFQVRVDEANIQCDARVVNRATIAWQNATLTSPEALTQIYCLEAEGFPDLGDAPDSTNHHGMDNTAYAGPVLGHFPTVWETTVAGDASGPAHRFPDRVRLGMAVTQEKDADVPPESDATTNILNNGTTDEADKDGADDGWLNPDVPLEACRSSTLVVRVSRNSAPLDVERMFLNVWIDGNRDGDWEDTRFCTADGQIRSFEWIVQNFVVNVGAIPASGFVDIRVPTVLIANEKADAASWMRFTLSEKPAVRSSTVTAVTLPDGRGPAHPDLFQLGETEDYLRPGQAQGEPGQIGIDKSVDTGGLTVVHIGDVMTYTVHLSHSGGSAPAATTMKDQLPPEVRLIRGPWVTEITPSVAPLHAYFDSSMGPQGMVGWQGHLSPGAALQVHFVVRVEQCNQDNQDVTRIIHNVAEAVQVDNTIIRADKSTPLACDLPQRPNITLEKHIVPVDDGGDGQPTTEWGFPSGARPVFLLRLSSADSVIHSVVVSDELPSGLVAVNASASHGQPRIINNGRGVVWAGDLGPANTPVEIKIQVRPAGELECDRRLINKAIWRTRFFQGESNEARLYLACTDLGDAPDSTNHAGVSMTAYAGPILGRFPTVFEVGAPERGPKHLAPRPFHLGEGVTAEREADIGFDADGVNNLRPALDQSNLDKRDDGIKPGSLGFKHCVRNLIPVQVSISPAAIALLTTANQKAEGYINVWLDGNRNGTWADRLDCPADPTGQPTFAQEHIVVDYAVNVAALGAGLHTINVPTSGPVYFPSSGDQAKLPAWLRITLSERPSNKTLCTTAPCAYGDGRGYDTAFRLGETEDYLLRPPTQEAFADPTVQKRGYIRPEFDPTGGNRFWQMTWQVDYQNLGSAPATNVNVVDTLLGAQTLLHENSWPAITPGISGNVLTYNVGTLAPSAHGSMVIETKVPYNTTPGTIFTNTVTVSSDNDSDSANNTSTVTVTVPILPPVITSPIPGTSCTGTLTVTGKAQVGVVVDLYVDSALHTTAAVDGSGDWSVPLSLSDGSHDLFAVARLGSLTSGPSATVTVIVDSSLFWNPSSLRFVDEDGHVVPISGRADVSGWSVFLRRGTVFTVSVQICCSDPNAQVELEIAGVGTVSLTDPDGDRIYEASFTTPSTGPITGTIRICVLCNLIQVCSDGTVLIDPEGTVFDLTTGAEVAAANVACYQSVVGAAGVNAVYDLWPAASYQQVNPQTTPANGYFSFFTPAGTYQVETNKSGYQRYRSWDLVVEAEPVHFDVPVTPLVGAVADQVINLSASGFEPAILTVQPGAVIQWVNVGDSLQTTTSITPTVTYGGAAAADLGSSDGWDSGLLNPGESYKRQLTAEGTYTYADHENPNLVATIIVAQPKPEFHLFLPIVARP